MAESHNLTAVISPPTSLVEVDDRSFQEDDETVLDLASITSSVLDYEFENGRRYHAYKAGSYPLPNDEVSTTTLRYIPPVSWQTCRFLAREGKYSHQLTKTCHQAELNRIDIKHHVFLLLCSGHLHLAPLENPKKILDLGTGTGIWAIEMADQYPEAMVIGTDLSPVQPTWYETVFPVRSEYGRSYVKIKSIRVPDNVRFEIDDFENQLWPWRENYFDYIHSRFLVGSVSSYPALIRKAFKHCKPGGYFELQDLNPRFYSDDGTLQENSSLKYWSKVMCEASDIYNRPVPHQDDFRAWFTTAGFEDVVQLIFKSPSNPSWPKNQTLKEAARFQLLALTEGLEGVSVGLLTRALEWKPEEVQVLMAKMRPELKNKAIHSYQPHFTVIGRKPDTSALSKVASSRPANPTSSLRTVPSQGPQGPIPTNSIPGTEGIEANINPGPLAASLNPTVDLLPEHDTS